MVDSMRDEKTSKRNHQKESTKENTFQLPFSVVVLKSDRKLETQENERGKTTKTQPVRGKNDENEGNQRKTNSSETPEHRRTLASKVDSLSRELAGFRP